MLMHTDNKKQSVVAKFSLNRMSVRRLRQCLQLKMLFEAHTIDGLHPAAINLRRNRSHQKVDRYDQSERIFLTCNASDNSDESTLLNFHKLTRGQIWVGFVV